MTGVHDYVQRHGFTRAVLDQRLSYFKITEDDLARMAGLRAFAARNTQGIIELFYEHLLAHPETGSFLADPRLVERLKIKQGEYFVSLFDGAIDLDYIEHRLRVGHVHERLGVHPHWYIGAYNRYVELLRAKMLEEFDAAQTQQHMDAVIRVMHFDAALALEAYVLANSETTARQAAAIRELATPVIKVYDGVLMLPLVGTVDSHRAQQIMQSVLERITDEQATVLILDIAGVGVVDTQVADYLLKTTAAVRLLGAETILTGISPQVARTIVELAVDISTMHTRSRLADGLELALRLVGKRIGDREAR